MARAAQATKTITVAQIKRIHTIINILGINDENYRAAMDSRFNVTTCKDLTLRQACTFIDELEKLARKVTHGQELAQKEDAGQQPTPPPRFSNLDNRAGMASAAQLRKIEAMWQDISIIPDHDARGRALRHFIKRITRAADMRFLDNQGAGKVINALNAMQKQSTESNKAKKSKNAV